jgi:hypothetical protein
MDGKEIALTFTRVLVGYFFNNLLHMLMADLLDPVSRASV